MGVVFPSGFDALTHFTPGLTAMELAEKVALNLPLTNFAICSTVSHMNNMSGIDAAYAEAVVAGVVNTQPAACARLEAFANSFRTAHSPPRVASRMQ